MRRRPQLSNLTEPSSLKKFGMQHPSYRKDIDGLRAIAVLLVVAFHASPSRVKAGFIGVDIFFVISGFLITQILVNAIHAGSLDIAGFYQRRVKRIFPALLLVLIFVSVFGFFVLYREEFQHLGYHISGASIFSANFFLWKESGYFDNTPELKPLLHLWSLAVEEQFYIFFPLLLWAFKERRARTVMLCVAFLVSFCYGVWQTAIDSNSAYLLPLSRFWELLAGALVAQCVSRLKNQPLRIELANTLSLIGLALIVIGMATITKANFPGAYALMPVLGAALLIGAGSSALVNRHLLSCKLLVGIGLVSYPWYLWHWVMFSFARIVYGNHAPPLLIVALTGASFLVAVFTYRFLEVPVRATKSKYVAPCLLLLMAILGAFGYFAMYRGVELQEKRGAAPVKRGAIDHPAFNQAFASLKNLCARYEGHPDNCPDAKSFREGTVAVLGDSHAEQFSAGLAMLRPRLNIAFYNALGLPVMGSAPTDFLVQEINWKHETRTVFIIALWEKRMNAADPTIVANLRRTIQSLQEHGKEVFLIDTVPYFPFLPQQCKYVAPWLRESRCAVASNIVMEPKKAHINMLKALAKETSVPFFSLSAHLCDPVVCSMDAEDYVLFRDESHVNAEGAQYVVRGFLADSGF